MDTTYTIVIQGMHCTGCKNLITLSLEEEGMKNISVDEKGGVASFDSALEKAAVIDGLDAAFKELTEYTYSNVRGKELV